MDVAVAMNVLWVFDRILPQIDELVDNHTEKSCYILIGIHKNQSVYYSTRQSNSAHAPAGQTPTPFIPPGKPLDKETAMHPTRRHLLLVSAASVVLTACGGSDDEHAPPNIVATAQATPNLSILVEAVVAAGLVEALSAPGPLTVFAPTNDAFVALLTELGVTKEALLADKPLLTAVLTYHVVAGRIPKASVPINAPITTLQGATFVVGSDLRITDGRGRSAAIVATDIECSNGLVHIIDKVILPPA